MKIPATYTIVNILISVFMFCFIFYSHAGVSGGDIAIVALNLMFGLLHIVIMSIFNKFQNRKFGTGLLTIVICQILQLIIFINWGYSINEFIKSIK